MNKIITIDNLLPKIKLGSKFYYINREDRHNNFNSHSFNIFEVTNITKHEDNYIIVISNNKNISSDISELLNAIRFIKVTDIVEDINNILVFKNNLAILYTESLHIKNFNVYNTLFTSVKEDLLSNYKDFISILLSMKTKEYEDVKKDIAKLKELLKQEV